MILPKKLLAPLIVAATLGTVVVGVVFLVQRIPPPTSPSATAVTPVVTPTTRAVPPGPEGKKPWPEPKFGEMIMASAISKDRKQMVMAQDYRNTAIGGAKLRVYDTSTWKEVRTLDLPEYRDFLRGLAITADGKRVFIGGDNRGVQLWDTDTNKLGKSLDTGPGKSMCRSLRLSPDGKRLVGHLLFIEGLRHAIRFWDVTTGEVVRTIPVEGVGMGDPLTFTDNGSTVAGMSEYVEQADSFRGVIEWDVNAGKESRLIDVVSAVGPYQPWPRTFIPNPWTIIPQSFAYAPDGAWLVVGGGYMAKYEDLYRRPQQSGGATHYLYSGRLWVMNRSTGKLVKTLIDDRSDLIRNCRVTNDGKKLLVTMTIPSRSGWSDNGNTDDEYVEIQRWDTTTWERDWVKFADKTERWKVWAETGG